MEAAERSQRQTRLLEQQRDHEEKRPSQVIHGTEPQQSFIEVEHEILKPFSKVNSGAQGTNETEINDEALKSTEH